MVKGCSQRVKLLSIAFLLFSCSPEEITTTYTVLGQVRSSTGVGIADVQIFFSDTESVQTDNEGSWTIENLEGLHTITPFSDEYTFTPTSIEVDGFAELSFTATRILSAEEMSTLSWFRSQQLPNGLLESTENGNIVSLYDNALAALVFLTNGDLARAGRIFDFFNARVSSELNNGVGGFSQFRDADGVPNNHRWMGDNAWLLIALNNYKAITGSTRYDGLSAAIQEWLISLQDTDGGLFAGYDADGNLLDFKVTEGNIDVYNAISGYGEFHSELLRFLENDRWDEVDRNLVAWPANPQYLYALDLHSWGYLIFEDYPTSALTNASRFLTTQSATGGGRISGYCFDEDQDVVWLEGTGQMALAFGRAELTGQKELYLNEMETNLIQSTNHPDAAGFPYASNPGTVYGGDPLWSGADTQIALSGGAWYLFAKQNFNPFDVGRTKNIPAEDKFWLD